MGLRRLPQIDGQSGLAMIDVMRFQSAHIWRLDSVARLERELCALCKVRLMT